MRVRILGFVEDSNIFEDVNDPLAARQHFTIGHRVKVLSEQISVVVRVDRISFNHGIVDLPEKQAQKLIKLGFAREPIEQDEIDNAIIRKQLEQAALDVLTRLGSGKLLASATFDSEKKSDFEAFEKMKKDLAKGLKDLLK